MTNKMSEKWHKRKECKSTLFLCLKEGDDRKNRINASFFRSSRMYPHECGMLLLGTSIV